MENGSVGVPGAGFSPRTEILPSQHPVFAVQCKQPGAGETEKQEKQECLTRTEVSLSLFRLKDNGQISNDTIRCP